MMSVLNQTILHLIQIFSMYIRGLLVIPLLYWNVKRRGSGGEVPGNFILGRFNLVWPNTHSIHCLVTLAPILVRYLIRICSVGNELRRHTLASLAALLRSQVGMNKILDETWRMSIT